MAYTTCKGCGKPSSEVGALSWTRLCIACSKATLESNVDQMVAREGPNFNRWRRAMAACVGGVLLDDVNAKP